MDNRHWYEEQKQQHFGDADTNKTRKKNAVSMVTLVVCMLLTALVGGAAGGLLTYGIGQTQERRDLMEWQDESAGEAPAKTPAVSTAPDASTETAVETIVTAAGAYTKSQIIGMSAPAIVGIDIAVNGAWSYGGGRSEVLSGSGSGIIVTSDGYIVTNNHVVSGASEIKVYLNDDVEYPATLIGSDERTDLAIIKIEAAGLTPVVMGDSDSLVVGDDVVAIGNPLGELRGSSTSGIISALARVINIEGWEMTLLQTDAAINPGNSGGGLFNMKGELIGVVNAKIASTTTEGLGFAIPVNDLKEVFSDLMDLGYVSGRAYLGVYTKDVAIASENQQGANAPFGDFFGFGGMQNYVGRVQIADVEEGGAADKAGIKAGDIVLAVNDIEISSANELAIKIREYNAGDVATIKVQRDDQELTFEVTFQEYIPNQS
ncbi:MAG: trypsin-like peptidase domain-containing protein [Clostridiales bacterium]|jgi:serine protease Do|nr:trypsin-like peptidase domain-containing protein [Clostridiales bacterium]